MEENKNHREIKKMKKIETIKLRTLILEDDLVTLAEIMVELFGMKRDLIGGKHIDFMVTVFSGYEQSQDYLNKISEPDFDIILLDRECKLGGYFNNLNINKFGADRIIEISSQPEHYKTATEMHHQRSIRNDYNHHPTFATQLVTEIKNILEMKNG